MLNKIKDDFNYHLKNNSILIEAIVFAFSLMVILMYFFESNHFLFIYIRESLAILSKKYNVVLYMKYTINTPLFIALLIFIFIFKNIYLILIYFFIGIMSDIFNEVYFLYNFIYFSLAFIIYWHFYLKNSSYLSNFKSSLNLNSYLNKNNILYFIILLLIYFEYTYYRAFFLYLLMQERFFNKENKISVLQNSILYPRTYLLSIIIILAVLTFCIEFNLLLHLMLSMLFMLFILFFFNNKKDVAIYRIAGYILCYLNLNILLILK